MSFCRLVKLIEFVKTNPMIYEVKNKNYKKTQLKMLLWKEICIEINDVFEREENYNFPKKANFNNNTNTSNILSLNFNIFTQFVLYFLL